MTLQEAMSSLCQALCPHGPYFMPHWLNGNGIRDDPLDSSLVLYCEPVRDAIRALSKLEGIQKPNDGNFYWEGYLVVIKECGPMRLL